MIEPGVVEGTGFLYPFIDGDEHDAGSLLADLARSAEGKAGESLRLRDATLEEYSTALREMAAEMAERFLAGGRMFSFGNGGSATDAASLAALFTRPPTGRALPARSLVADAATLTALGNDVGFELVFSRQLIAQAREGDMAVGFSTSGNSDNVIGAFGEAKRRRLLTIGLAGYEGGSMAACADLDHCIVVRSDSVHRIQETQDAVVLALWANIQGLLESKDVP
ncbi:MAG: SIS domain-containing protein [Acidimicrobiales bacterium]|jgi:D-sedoheptulose 7-phosphate isomerase